MHLSGEDICCRGARDQVRCRRCTSLASLPVPWAGDDRTSSGARDIFLLRWLVGVEERERTCSSSVLVSDVATDLAFSGTSLPVGEEPVAAQSVTPARPDERGAAIEDNSCPASSAICMCWLTTLQGPTKVSTKQASRAKVRYQTIRL